MASTPGRNEPCPCGSGRKYKVCCYAKDTADRLDFARCRAQSLADEVIPLLADYAHDRFKKRDFQKAQRDFALGFSSHGLDPEDFDFRLMFVPWISSLWVPPELSKLDDPYPRPTAASTFLAEKGDTLPSDRRDFIRTLMVAMPSFYQVRKVVPGRSLAFKDLFFDNDIEVTERDASRGLHPGDIVYTRVLRFPDTAILIGTGGIAFPPSTLDHVLDLRDLVLRQTRQLAIGPQALPTILEPHLRRAYFSMRQRMEEPAFPQLNNTDGERLEFCDITYELKTTPEEAFPLLASLCFAEKPEDILAGAERDKNGNIQKVDFTWLKKGNGRISEWDNTVMGNIVLTPGKLKVQVNSEERAKAARAEIEKRLGTRAVFMGLTLESPRAGLQSGENGDNGGHSAISQEEIDSNPVFKAKLEDFAHKHWAAWFDEPIPMLRDKTPRQAAETKEGRALLEALLFEYAQHDAAHPGNLFKADIPYLKSELGLE